MQRGGVGGAYPTGSGASISNSPHTQPSFTSSGMGASPIRRTALPLAGARSGHAGADAVAVVVAFVFVVAIVFVVAFVFGIVLVVVVVVVVVLTGAVVAIAVGAVVAVAVLVASICEAQAVKEQRASEIRVRFMPTCSTKPCLWTQSIAEI